MGLRYAKGESKCLFIYFGLPFVETYILLQYSVRDSGSGGRPAPRYASPGGGPLPPPPEGYPRAWAALAPHPPPGVPRGPAARG